MTAFATMHMQCGSFLERQRRFEKDDGASNCQTLYGIDRIPGDGTVRTLLDPVPPSLLSPAFDAGLEVLRAAGGLSRFEVLGGRHAITFDGTQYHCSDKVKCPKCSHRTKTVKRGDEKQTVTEHFHTAVVPMVVRPGLTKVLPLPAEFVTPQDGHGKQDCEMVATRRWFAAHGARYLHLRPVMLGDDLYSNHPMLTAVKAAKWDFVVVAKPDSHKTLYEYVDGAIDMPVAKERFKQGKTWRIITCRWLKSVPVRGGGDALEVNWLDMTVTDEKTGKVVHRNSFVTSLDVDASNVVDIATVGRTRWKTENEGFNTLKNLGYAFEHNFGHGSDNLSSVLASLNLLAFLFHTVCALTWDRWAVVVDKYRSNGRLVVRIAHAAELTVFTSWEELLDVLGKKVRLVIAG